MDECPCGLDFPYTDCCAPLVRGVSYADTAEDLMRSRYTAYTMKNWDYLIKTTHSSEGSKMTWSNFEAWNKGIQWEKLEILENKGGEMNDAEGVITFVATYIEDDEENTLHETSRFLKENGKWVYSEKKSTVHPPKKDKKASKPFVRSGEKVGRNDPCTCGSGKKFKKCCGK